MDRAAELIEHLLSKPDSCESDGTAANELLTGYFSGSPIETLRILLSSSDDRLVGVGTWIAAELAESGKPLLKDVQGLLGHRSKDVRFWAIECVHEWAGPANGDVLASTVALVDDTERAVRWKAMTFLALASGEQLQAAAAQFGATNPDSPYLDELKCLLGPEGSTGTLIIGRLRGDDALRRKFAAAAAFRIAKNDSEALRYAASVDDSEIAQFAGDMLKRILLS